MISNDHVQKRSLNVKFFNRNIHVGFPGVERFCGDFALNFDVLVQI